MPRSRVPQAVTNPRRRAAREYRGSCSQAPGGAAEAAPRHRTPGNIAMVPPVATFVRAIDWRAYGLLPARGCSMTEDPSAYEALFLQHLAYIEETLAGVAHVFGFRDDDAEEFRSWGRERLLEKDYAVLRKWRGQSKLTTYLHSVITNLGNEFRVKHWGRWRPSAAAVRAGALAVRLERLLYRDGWTFVEAAQLLRGRGDTDCTDRELAEIMARIPQRPRRSRSSDVALRAELIPDDSDPANSLTEAEEDAERVTIRALLASAMATLEPMARIVITMHFMQGRTLADIARTFRTEQKPLYRVKDNALRSLRHHLEEAGVTWESLAGLLGGAIADVPREVHVTAEPSPPTEVAPKKDQPGDKSNALPSNGRYDAGSAKSASRPDDADRSRRADT